MTVKLSDNTFLSNQKRNKFVKTYVKRHRCGQRRCRVPFTNSFDTRAQYPVTISCLLLDSNTI